MIYKVSTTGAVSEIVLNDMGERIITHPIVELDLGLEYTDDELIDSEDLATAVSNGWITVNEKSGGPVNEEEAQQISQNVVSEAIGGSVATFTGLTDTPSYYAGHNYYYAASSTSGIIWKSNYLDAEVHVSAYYTGESDGSASSPFNNVYATAAFLAENYSGTGKKVAVILHPGEYILPYHLPLTIPEVKSFVGLGNKTVILKPTNSLLGLPFITSYKTVEIVNITLDATDNPAFAITEGSVGFSIMDDSYDTNILRDVHIKGFHRGLASSISSSIWAKNLEVYDATVGICVTSGCLFDADDLYIDCCRDKHVCVAGGAEVYIGQSEISSYYIEGLVGSGIGVHASGEDTYVELFGGTNIWSCYKNIVVDDGAEIKIDNCVLEETDGTPGIQQSNNSFMTIINSRAPLGSDDLYVENPENVYINAFDSTGGTVTIGNGNHSTQTIFTFNTGQSDRPQLNYVPYHNTDYRALSFSNPIEGENTEIFVESNNSKANLGIHPTGTTAWSFEASLGLVSVQDGERRGWNITKEEGAVPNLTIKNKNDVTALEMNYSGELKLNSGEYVDKILNDFTFSANDSKALVTQSSTKSFVESWSYSKSELNSGQLNNIYYTEAEVNTISGTIDNKMLYVNGSKELTSDWDAGDYSISANGFSKDNIKVDLAGYANITGILTGGEISINGSDNTKLDIAAGKGIFVNMIDRDDPYVEIISWDASTISPNLSGIRSKWVGVERTAPGIGGQIIVQSNFTQYEKRFTIILGRCWGNGTDVINGCGNYKSGAFSFGKSMQDIAYAIGSINITGNNFYPTASGSMLLSRTAGESFRFSANYENENLSPNISSSTTVSGISSYSYHIQNQLYINNETEIDSNYYDNNGTKTVLPTDKWTTQLIYYFPVSNTTHVVYGQQYHDTYAEAYDHVSTSNYVLNSSILEGSILRGYLFLKQGCMDLTDVSQAKLVEVIGFGIVGGGTVGGGVIDHGALSGLGDDDHHIYIKEDGTRSFLNKVSYTYHPTFDNDTELVDKKYVDDEISGLTADHGELTGLLDDDHPQYHTDDRGDARYYTQEQIDTISGSIVNQLSISEASVVQIRRTTDFTPTTEWQDVTFNVLDIESSMDSIEWDDLNPDRILIKVSGLYEISYSFPARSSGATREVYARILKNDTTEIDGSYTNQDLYQDETHQQDRTLRVNLIEGDFVSLQISVESTPVNILGNQIISVAKLDGVKGEKGDPGEQGPQGIVTVSGSAYFDAYDSAGSLTLNTSWQDVPFNVVRKNSGEYEFDSNTELTLPTNTSYFITARVTTNITLGSNRSDCRIRIVKDVGYGYIEIPGTIASTYNRLVSEGTTTAVSILLDDFSAGDKIKVQVRQNSGTDTINLLANGSSLTVFIPAGAEGPQGPKGEDGIDGIDAGGTLALVQARRTTSITDVPLTWTDFSFDTTDLEYDDTHIEHDDINRDRFLIKKDGYYYIAINLSVDDEVTIRVRKNDSTIIPGSTRPVGNTSDANDMISAMQNTCIAQLSTGDYVSVQVQSVTTNEEIFSDATFIIFALIGAKGDKGDPGTPGSGSTINIYEDGSPITDTPHSLINFIGSGVSVSNVDGDQVNIEISGGISGITIQDESSNIANTPHHTINFTGSPVSTYDLGGGVAGVWIQDPIFGSWYAWDGDELETNTNSAYTYITKATLSVTGVPAGYYRVSWYYEWRRNSASNDFMASIVIDGTTILMEHREETQDVNTWHTNCGFGIVQLSSGNHASVLGYCGDSSGNTSYIRRARLEFWRVA